MRPVLALARTRIPLIATASRTAFALPFATTYKLPLPPHRNRRSMTTQPSTMHAVLYPTTGDPSIIVWGPTPSPPAPGPNQLLIRNKFVGVNFIDTYHRSGLYKVAHPFIPGREASGVVEAVGEGVKGFKVGDRVAYATAGCAAELTLANADFAIGLPEKLGFEEGAALLLQGLTVMSLVKMAYEVKKGDYVLVHAAAGGTGLLLTQVCKHLGAYVIGTTSTPEKAALARSHGCDDVILYTSTDVPTEVKRITGGAGVHVVYDGVGKTTFDASLASLRRLGTLASFGNASGKVADVDIMKLVPRAVRLMRPSLFELMKDKADFEFLVTPLLELVEKGELKLHIHKVYDIKDTAEAHRDLEGRKTTGKLLLKL
ncbi:NADPH:quinone reductase [Phlyctochytrium bullatum]|nr:NADPH:quinone reductase [Phlyctochytrium bullatum]